MKKEKKIKKKKKIKKRKKQISKKDEAVVAERKRKKKAIIITLILNIIGSAVVLGIYFIWEKKYDLMAWSNAVTLSWISIFFVGWIMFIHNQNIISMFTHSLKTFGLMLVGKRPAKSYYEVKTEIEENPIPKKYLITTFAWSGVLLIATIVLTILTLI